VQIQNEPQPNGVSATVRLRNSGRAKPRGRRIGLQLLANPLDSTTIQDTAPAEFNGLFGDGIALLSQSAQSTAVLRNSLVARSARAGLDTFGATAVISAMTFECNLIDLDGEPYAGYAFQLDDQGGNYCGCNGSTISCQLSFSNLQPPLIRTAPLPASMLKYYGRPASARWSIGFAILTFYC
jgi:hypothetical protein